MSEQNVRIVKLEPMRVASAWGFGESPEIEAWKNLEAWAKPKGMLDDPEEHRVFGFNNPDPSPGSPNYGYEFWISVGPDIKPEGDIRIQGFSGGLYAVMACTVGDGDPWDIIPAAWKRLNAWVADSEYRPAGHQWLEEHTLGGELLDLYFPIAK